MVSKTIPRTKIFAVKFETGVQVQFNGIVLLEVILPKIPSHS